MNLLDWYCKMHTVTLGIDVAGKSQNPRLKAILGSVEYYSLGPC